MRCFLLYCCLGFLATKSTPVQAQFFQPKWQLGLELGGSLSSMFRSSSTAPILSPLAGFRAGTYAQYRLSHRLGLKAGLFFTLRGAHYAEKHHPGLWQRNWHMHGYNVPLMVVGRLTPKVQLEVGIELNLAMGSWGVYHDYGSQYGPRAVLGWNWHPKWCLMAYGAYLFPNVQVPHPTEQRGEPYRNVVLGISVSLQLFSTVSKEAPPLPAPYCPRY